MMALSLTTLLFRGIAGGMSLVKTDGALPPDAREQARQRAKRIRRHKQQRLAQPTPQDLADLNGTSKWRSRLKLERTN